MNVYLHDSFQTLLLMYFLDIQFEMWILLVSILKVRYWDSFNINGQMLNLDVPYLRNTVMGKHVTKTYKQK